MHTQMKQKMIAAGVAEPELKPETPQVETKVSAPPVEVLKVSAEESSGKAKVSSDSADVLKQAGTKAETSKHAPPQRREQANKEKKSANGNAPHLVIPQLRVSSGHKPRAYAPHGTIQPGQLFTLNPYQMGDVARKIAGLGQHPEVLLYTPVESGYDVLRIAVMVKGGGKKAFLAITSATGSYAEKFGGYIGEVIFLDELGGKSEVPPNRTERTKAVHEVLSQVIEKIQASRK